MARYGALKALCGSVADDGGLVRLTLYNGVSVVGKPVLDRRYVSLRHPTFGKVAHVVAWRAIAVASPVATERPLPKADDRKPKLTS